MTHGDDRGPGTSPKFRGGLEDDPMLRQPRRPSWGTDPRRPARAELRGRSTSASGGGGSRKGPKDLPKRIVATNRKARHDYAISWVVEAGLALLGSEVKSLRQGAASLQDGFARVDQGEVWLHGVHVPPLPQASYRNHEPTRRRRCLLHKREIRKLEALVDAKGTTIVPLSLYFLGPHVKVELGVGRGKRLFDKREDMKRHAAEREIRQATRRR